MREPRGLAVADAVETYRRELRTWADGRDLTPTERSLFESLGDHVTRIKMLDGDVAPQSADSLLEAVRDLGVGIRERDESALGRAGDRLDRLE